MRRQMEGSTLVVVRFAGLAQAVARVQALDLYLGTRKRGKHQVVDLEQGTAGRHKAIGILRPPAPVSCALANSRPNLAVRSASDSCWRSSTASVCARLIGPGVSCQGPRWRRSRSVSMYTLRQRRRRATKAASAVAASRKMAAPVSFGVGAARQQRAACAAARQCVLCPGPGHTARRVPAAAWRGGLAAASCRGCQVRPELRACLRS